MCVCVCACACVCVCVDTGPRKLASFVSTALLESISQAKLPVYRTTNADSQAAQRKQFTHEHHFDPEAPHGVYPPRSAEFHSVRDYVDTEGDALPGQVHPYG